MLPISPVPGSVMRAKTVVRKSSNNSLPREIKNSKSQPQKVLETLARAKDKAKDLSIAGSARGKRQTETLIQLLKFDAEHRQVPGIDDPKRNLIGTDEVGRVAWQGRLWQQQ